MQTRKYQWKKKEVDQPTSLHLAKELNVSKVISWHKNIDKTF